jgi:hypothetical protein
MKSIMLLLSASLSVAASGALAQGQGDACSPGYGTCMNHCSSRPQSLQESCAKTCETNTDQCYQSLYGQAPQDGAVSSQASTPAPEARVARDQVKPVDKLKRR